MTRVDEEPEILAELARILADFQGREYSGPIDRETRFSPIWASPRSTRSSWARPSRITMHVPCPSAT